MITNQLTSVELDVTTEYNLYPGRDFVVHLGTAATLEFYSGDEWKEYPSASGGEVQDKDFIFVTPASGRVRIVIAAESAATVSLYPKA